MPRSSFAQRFRMTLSRCSSCSAPDGATHRPARGLTRGQSRCRGPPTGMRLAADLHLETLHALRRTHSRPLYTTAHVSLLIRSRCWWPPLQPAAATEAEHLCLPCQAFMDRLALAALHMLMSAASSGELNAVLPTAATCFVIDAAGAIIVAPRGLAGLMAMDGIPGRYLTAARSGSSAVADASPSNSRYTVVACINCKEMAGIIALCDELAGIIARSVCPHHRRRRGRERYVEVTLSSALPQGGWMRSFSARALHSRLHMRRAVSMVLRVSVVRESGGGDTRQQMINGIVRN